MARFDVYPNPGRHASATPYLLDVQSGLLDGLDSRVVIPLRDAAQFPPVRLPERLMPTFEIEGKPFVLETPKLAPCRFACSRRRWAHWRQSRLG